MVLLKEMHFSFHFLGLKIICLENFHKSFLVNDCRESQSRDREGAAQYGGGTWLVQDSRDVHSPLTTETTGEKRRQTEMLMSVFCSSSD